MKLTVRLFLLLPIIACSPDPGPPPDIPDSATVCEGSCMILEHFECPEGLDPQCQPKCEKIHSLGYLWPDDTSGPACVVGATTLAQVRACNVKCEVEN